VIRYPGPHRGLWACLFSLFPASRWRSVRTAPNILLFFLASSRHRFVRLQSFELKRENQKHCQNQDSPHRYFIEMCVPQPPNQTYPILTCKPHIRLCWVKQLCSATSIFEMGEMGQGPSLDPKVHVIENYDHRDHHF
jgi:hypothetical protein